MTNNTVKSMATKFLNEIRAETLGDSAGNPSLGSLLDAMRPSLELPTMAGGVDDSADNSGDNSLSLSSNDDAPGDESHPHPKPRPKRPKTMPAAKDWMSHQRMRDSSGNIVKCQPKFSQWFTSHFLHPNLKARNFMSAFATDSGCGTPPSSPCLTWSKKAMTSTSGPSQSTPVLRLLPRLSCCSLAHFATLEEAGPLTALKSRLPSLERCTESSFMCSPSGEPPPCSKTW